MRFPCSVEELLEHMQRHPYQGQFFSFHTELSKCFSMAPLPMIYNFDSLISREMKLSDYMVTDTTPYDFGDIDDDI